ncbi:MAG: trimethylamine methyltransferase family protein, partial [Pirellulales bacterium]|nr:trimethylamine methyltransferase family protein [Pirellulales bacterium]
MSARRSRTSKRTRSGGRAQRRQDRQGTPPPRLPYIQRQVGTYNLLGEEGLSLIEANAETILKEIGMEFRDDPEVLEIWREAGAEVRGERVRFEPGMCRSLIQATAPRQFRQHARNPELSVEIGGDNSLFCPSFGPPFVHDMDQGRRYATLADFESFTKL